MSFSNLGKKEKKVIEKVKVKPLREFVTKSPKINFEKFVVRNLDMLKKALNESIKQYQTKKYQTSRENVKRYRQIFWKLVKIEKEVDKV
ncbi:MAG: hypothetical protein OEL89_00530 [Candidatus Peregrinibacteria bacterium]|nr:hypothetical protein [Candidatus Peregrinibacteria bacterium]